MLSPTSACRLDPIVWGFSDYDDWPEDRLWESDGLDSALQSSDLVSAYIEEQLATSDEALV